MSIPFFMNPMGVKKTTPAVTHNDFDGRDAADTHPSDAVAYVGDISVGDALRSFIFDPWGEVE